MAVRIRLSRTGKRHRPHYRIVVADSQTKRDGKAIEILGWYRPTTNEVNYDQDRLQSWLQKGASMSDRVRLLVTGEKRHRTKSRKETKELATPAKTTVGEPNETDKGGGNQNTKPPKADATAQK